MDQKKDRVVVEGDMMRTFEARLRDQATLSLDITERVLSGALDIPEAQRRTALSMISGQLKQQAVSNGRVTQIISLTRLGVRDPAVRERIALTALAGLLPSAMLASGPVEAERAALAEGSRG